MPSAAPSAVVLGMGNLLMGDEGVGIHVVRSLASALGGDSIPGVETVEIGTAGMRAVHAIAGKDKAIFVDCALMDSPPGTIRRFTPEDVRSRKRLRGFSTHDGDLLGFIALSRRLGECPPDVVLFGIEPRKIGPGMRLSPELDKNIAYYLTMIRGELEHGAGHG